MRFHIVVLLSQISFIFRSNVIRAVNLINILLILSVSTFICEAEKVLPFPFRLFIYVFLFTNNNRIVVVLNKLSAELNTMPTLRISLKYFETDGKKRLCLQNSEIILRRTEQKKKENKVSS